MERIELYYKTAVQLWGQITKNYSRIVNAGLLSLILSTGFAQAQGPASDGRPNSVPNIPVPSRQARPSTSTGLPNTAQSVPVPSKETNPSASVRLPTLEADVPELKDALKYIEEHLGVQNLSPQERKAITEFVVALNDFNRIEKAVQSGLRALESKNETQNIPKTDLTKLYNDYFEAAAKVVSSAMQLQCLHTPDPDEKTSSAQRDLNASIQGTLGVLADLSKNGNAETPHLLQPSLLSNRFRVVGVSTNNVANQTARWLKAWAKNRYEWSKLPLLGLMMFLCLFGWGVYVKNAFRRAGLLE